MAFVWIPGTPPNQDAIERLKQHFPKPAEPPPEAWFMGEKRYHSGIIEGDPINLPLPDLALYLLDTSGGLKIFTEVEFAQERWRETFGYLWPRLIKRSHEDFLLSDLIAYFFQVHPDSIPDIYPEYRKDVLNTLGNAIMRPAFWDEYDLATDVIQCEWDNYHLYGSHGVFKRTLSAAMYWCLKYLTPSEVTTWTESLVQIQGIHWHFKLMNWLFAEAFALLIHFDGDDIPESQTVMPQSHFGRNAEISEFQLSRANVQAFISRLKKHRLYLSLSTE